MEQRNQSIISEITENIQQTRLMVNLARSELYNQIIPTLRRLEFSQREEDLRRDKLARLKKFPTEFSLEESSFLGEGAYGIVKRGSMDNNPVAIKIVKAKGPIFSDHMLKSLENEVLLMSICNHPCVLNIFGYCQADHQTFYLILELSSLGSLWSVLDNRRVSLIPWSLSIAWISDILAGLCHLHQLKIIHGDLKAENVLVSEGLRCKLTDFGLSKLQLESSFGVPSTHAGTFTFMSPEKRGHGQSSHRSDVYSCGVTSYQIIFRSLSQNMDHSQMIELLSRTDKSESWSRFVKGCFSAETTRLSSREAFDLITKFQNTESVGGDPRQSRTHHSYSEVEVLKKVFVCNRAESTERDPEKAKQIQRVSHYSAPLHPTFRIFVCHFS
jgi:serine/threonine protein kinase